VQQLKRVVEQLAGTQQSRRPALVGASMGGGTSLVAVGEDHVDATALVLVDIAPRVARMPDVVSSTEAEGSIPVGNTPAQFRQILKTESAIWRKVVQDNAIRIAE